MDKPILSGKAWEAREAAEVCPVPVTEITRDGGSRTAAKTLLTENRLAVRVNEQDAMRIVCTPTDLHELVLGRLLTEGIIQSADDIDVLYICPEGTRAEVILREGVLFRTSGTEETPTCCTNNHVLIEGRRDLKPVQPLAWEPAWIWKFEDRFAQDTRLHRLTHSSHSAFLMFRGDIRYEAEDIGRHNALDKVIGMALRDHIDRSECLLYTSGRVPVDMARKAIRAGIPVMVSKEAPTAESVLLAREYGLQLIGGVKKGRMDIYGKSSGDAFTSLS